MTGTNLIDKSMRYLDLCEMEEPLWSIYHSLLDGDQEDTEEFKEIYLRLARIASEKNDIEHDFDHYIAELPEHERWRYDNIRESAYDSDERYRRYIGLYLEEHDEAEPALSDEQINLLLSEAPSYTDPDAFVSGILTSSMFLDPEDEDAEIPTELSELLHKIWHVAALPFKDFLACMDLTQTECSRRYCIPLRTVQGWAGGSRTPPMYVRYMIAQLELYLDL